MKLPEEIVEILRRPLDTKAISPHPTKTYLSSIKAVYVTERFNEAFGIGQWKNKVEVISENPTNGMVVVKCIFEVPEYDIYYECFGGNDNGGSTSKNFDLGDAYKGANTDALTKIGSWLEVGIDVFKGLNDRPKNNNNDKPSVDVWMNDKQFNQAMADPEKAQKAIQWYDNKTTQEDGKVYGMKKDYRNSLKAATAEL